MSELTPPRRRRRRADATRSVNAILDAAVVVLAERTTASIEEIAAAAGVTRQTVYAHYPSREALIAAVIHRITEEAMSAIDAADLDRGPAPAALLRFLDAGWRTFERYQRLFQAMPPVADPQEDHNRHQPVMARLERLIRRGQDAGEFDANLSPAWLLAATVGLGHAAGEEVIAGRMTVAQATEAVHHSLLRVFGVNDPSAFSGRSTGTRA